MPVWMGEVQRASRKNEKNLLAAAKKIGALTKKFLKNNSKANLAGIDALIPTKTKGKAAA